MKTRQRQPTEEQRPRSLDDLSTPSKEGSSLEHLSDAELEALLFDESEQDDSKGLLNLPTMAGLSLIVVGIAYLFQQLGMWGGVELGTLVSWLPWLAGILIILLGFGVLSWRPKKKKKKAKKAVDAKTGKKKVVVEAEKDEAKKRLRKSARDKKIAGVCGGIAEYLNIDPTLVRIAFVIGTFFNGVGILIYLALAFIMSKPEPDAEDPHITIIRDS
jgi:phage shock protein C